MNELWRGLTIAPSLLSSYLQVRGENGVKRTLVTARQQAVTILTQAEPLQPEMLRDIFFTSVSDTLHYPEVSPLIGTCPCQDIHFRQAPSPRTC